MIDRMRMDGAPVVKICGLRRPADLVAAHEAGADLIGLVFAPSRRRLGVDEARALLQSVPDRPPAVGIYVNASADEMNTVADAVGLAFVQLCGEETAGEAARLRVPYMKVIHLRPDTTAAQALHIMSGYRDAAAFLLDSPSLQGGGSGAVADWVLAAEIVARADRPVLLAGGLSPSNVAAGLATTGAHGVDVSSGVERDGWKDPDLIRQFVRAARARLVPGPADAGAEAVKKG